jgi:hypothetical protein
MRGSLFIDFPEPILAVVQFVSPKETVMTQHDKLFRPFIRSIARLIPSPAAITAGAAGIALFTVPWIGNTVGANNLPEHLQLAGDARPAHGGDTARAPGVALFPLPQFADAVGAAYLPEHLQLAGDARPASIREGIGGITEPSFGEPSASYLPVHLQLTDTARHAPVREVSEAPDQEKYKLKVPGGLAFSEFRGYEDWAVVAIDHTEDLMKEIVGNPVAIAAFRAGIPGNGKPFPDGAKIAKVEWHPKKSADAPYDINVPGPNYDLDFMVKDARRFADSGGWGYAVFKYDGASGMYEPATQAHKPPQGNDAKCGAACHTIVSKKDYVFTDYAKR